MVDGRLARTRVGVLGTGDVGRRLAAGFSGRGHDVVIGTRDPDKPELREWLSADGAGVRPGSFADAAKHGELLVMALLGNAAEEVISDVGAENFTGKVVIDAMNPLDFSGGFPPKLSISGEDSLGERVQRALPDAKVVKAFNTIGNPYFVDPSFSEGSPTMLIAGDDEGAKGVVRDVLSDFGWADTVDIGGIDGSRELEAICIAWVKIGGARGAWTTGSSCSWGSCEARPQPRQPHQPRLPQPDRPLTRLRKLQSQGVHHITLVGAGRRTSIDFWEGVLGMPFVFEQPNFDNAADSHLYFDPGDGRLITVFTNEERKPDPTRTSTEVGCVHHLAFAVSQSTFKQTVERLDERGIRHSGVKDRGFMDSIYFEDPLGLLIELASYRFEPPAGYTHADVLLEAHTVRTARGDYNIDQVHLADAIQALVERSRATLSDDRTARDPYPR